MVRILNQRTDFSGIHHCNRVAEGLHFFNIGIDDLKDIVPVLGQDGHPHVSAGFGQADGRRKAAGSQVENVLFILFLVLGEFDVVAEFKSALVIRPVYLCLLRIDGYVIAGNGDLIADRCANNVVSIYVVKRCTDSSLCRSACLDTRRTDSILALVR